MGPLKNSEPDPGQRFRLLISVIRQSKRCLYSWDVE